MAITAVYVDADTFTVDTDKTTDLVANRKLLCDCGVDGYKYCVVASSSYGAPNTTVELTADSDDLTANLVTVEWSVVKPGTAGNIVVHTHVDEDTGGGALTNFLPLAGGTMAGNITIPNGGTIGQAAGPLLTFDDTSNLLTLTGGNLRLPALPTHASDAVTKDYVDQYSEWQGLSWNESTDAYTRRGSLAGLALESSPGDGVLPIQAAMRRCVISDAGVVQYYLDATDSTKKADGSASDLTGADGQVMVEIPKFYYKYSWLANVHTWDISYHERPGYVVHPAFTKNGAEVDFRYLGAYEGVLYDDSQSVYTSDYNPVASHSATFDVDNGDSKGTITAGAGTPYALLQAGDVIVVTGTADNNGTYIIDTVTDTVITCTTVIVGADGVEATTVISAPAVSTANDILSSVSGKKAFTGITRASFRLIAAKRGTGWRQFDFYLASAIQLLYLIEYADFYSQSMIGNGLTDWVNATWGTYNAYHAINNGGLSNGDGNVTANATLGTGTVGSYMNYRGIENWYGQLWKFVDGFNINDNIPYFCNTDTDFADDTAANYDAPGVTLHTVNGYQGALEQIDEGFLPADVTGTSSTKITDYYQQDSGWCVARAGGDACHEAYAGGFLWYLHNAAAYSNAYVGGRLAY